MAKIVDYVNSLLPQQEKARILEKIQETQAEINNITLPAYRNAETLVKLGGYKSPMFKEYSDSSKRSSSMSTGHIVKDVTKALEHHNENLTKLASIVERDSGEEITIESLTYRKAACYQLIASINGFVRYSTRLIGFLWLCEVGDIEEKTIHSIRQPEYLWLKNHRPEFFASLEVGLKKPKDLAKSVNELPELIVNPDTASKTEAVIGEQNTITKNFTVSYSPIFHIRRWKMKYDEDNAERMEADKVWLDECYQRALRDKEDGGRNPAVEKRLAVYGDRLKEIDAKLERYNKKPE